MNKNQIEKMLESLTIAEESFSRYTVQLQIFQCAANRIDEIFAKKENPKGVETLMQTAENASVNAELARIELEKIMPVALQAIGFCNLSKQTLLEAVKNPLLRDEVKAAKALLEEARLSLVGKLELDLQDVDEPEAVAAVVAVVASKCPPGYIDVGTAASRLRIPVRTARHRCQYMLHPFERAEQHGGRWSIPEADVPE